MDSLRTASVLLFAFAVSASAQVPEALEVLGFEQHTARLQVPAGFRGGPRAALAVEIGHGMESARRESRSLALSLGVPVLSLTPEGTHWSPYGTHRAKFADHVGFVRAATRLASERLGVPPGRALPLGGSSGGDLAYTLACGHPDEFSACLPIVPGSVWVRDETAAPRVGVVILAGEADWRVKAARACVERLRARDAVCYLRVVPGLGHRQPPADEHLPALRAALALLAPRRAAELVGAARHALSGPDPELARCLLAALPEPHRVDVAADPTGLEAAVDDLERRLVTLDARSAKRLKVARAALAERDAVRADRELRRIRGDARASLGAQHQADVVALELQALLEDAFAAALELEPKARAKALRALERDLRRVEGCEDLRQRVARAQAEGA